MASKHKQGGDHGSLRKSERIIIEKINREYSRHYKKSGRINPLLMPEKITGRNPVKTDILDMKSKKIIENLGKSITDLSTINPLDEGGFGYDHPAVKSKKKLKKNPKSIPGEVVNENLDEYSALVIDLKKVMLTLAANREEIFTGSSRKD